MKPPSDELPAWAGELAELYESGAASQFILHGNVRDPVLLPGAGGPRIAPLEEFLRAVLLGKFDVVLGYDIGNGLRVEKGGDTFAQWPAGKDKALPAAPRDAVHLLTHYLRFCANLSKLKPEKAVRAAVIVRGADLIAPPSTGGASYDLSGIAWQLHEWAGDPAIAEQHCATFLIAENLNDLHPLIATNPKAARLTVPLPRPGDIERALALLHARFPVPLQPFAARLAEPAAALAGATLHAIETLMRRGQHRGAGLGPGDLVELKKELIERDAQGLIEFLEPSRTLDDLHGQEAVKAWLRQDVALWRAGDLAAMPMGYLFCGPVGTGKTFLVECLAGEAGAPVVKMKNFRDRWVGSTEGNLEKIFRLLDALGRCLVFVDEADQALGRRSSDSGDSGVSGRVYGMMAEQMSRTRNRGRVIWVLATSRPDLIEVDLKRPGRVDVKIPLFPAATEEEGYGLLCALARRRGVALPDAVPAALRGKIPDLLTPGAAEALAVRLYRTIRTGNAAPETALGEALAEYQPPVPVEILARQIELAVGEATDMRFVPERFRMRS